MKQSSFFTLGWADLGKGIIMAVIGAVIGTVYGMVTAGQFVFDWTAIWHAVLLATVTYLSKNLLTNSSDQFMSTEKK
jgi:uncharacterized membrane protein YvlD (DUF360 family)